MPDASMIDSTCSTDTIVRCSWSLATPDYIDYHDTEWGMPVHDEHGLFERLTLEAFQSGLSWLTILRKRPAFREAFAGFDPDLVAAFSDADIERLMEDAGIVRNRRKIEAARINAKAIVALRQAGGLDHLIWSHQPESTRKPETHADIPTQTPESKALATDLKSQGFVFVGPTTAYALMTAIGMEDTHLVSCHRRGSSGVFDETGARR